MSHQINFNQYVATKSDLKPSLTLEEIDELVILVTHGCRYKTKTRLRSILTYGINSIDSYGIFNRLIKENGKWTYVAGQSYTDEIRTVRECILGRV